MAGYAVPTNRPFVTTKPIKMKLKMTDELRNYREYLSTHTAEVYRDPVTKKIVGRIIEIKKDEENDWFARACRTVSRNDD